MVQVEKQFDNATGQMFTAKPKDFGKAQIVHFTIFQMHLKVDMVNAAI